MEQAQHLPPPRKRSPSTRRPTQRSLVHPGHRDVAQLVLDPNASKSVKATTYFFPPKGPPNAPPHDQLLFDATEPARGSWQRDPPPCCYHHASRPIRWPSLPQRQGCSVEDFPPAPHLFGIHPASVRRPFRFQHDDHRTRSHHDDIHVFRIPRVVDPNVEDNHSDRQNAEGRMVILRAPIPKRTKTRSSPRSNVETTPLSSHKRRHVAQRHRHAHRCSHLRHQQTMARPT